MHCNCLMSNFLRVVFDLMRAEDLLGHAGSGRAGWNSSKWWMLGSLRRGRREEERGGVSGELDEG